MRKTGKVTVYTTGVFDLLHPGHVVLLRRAKRLGDRLIVGLQNDASVESQKGRRPIMTFRERKTMLLALPFVDSVIPYSDIDQRKLLKKLKPNIVVQGGDWQKTGDRRRIIAYLKNNGIKLVQFPYTKEVSTTEIKERVYESLKDLKIEKASQYDIKKRLKLVSLDALLTYEMYDPMRAEAIVESVKRCGYFFDPITVGSIGSDKYVVIDGANRLRALTALGAKYVPIQWVDYLVGDEVELRGNEHYLDLDEGKFLNLIKKNGILLEEGAHESALCLIYCGGDTLSLPDQGSLSKNCLSLNKLVKSYKGKVPIRRKSETGSIVGSAKVVLKFRPFSPADIVEVTVTGKNLESGITWHKVQDSIVRFRIPVNDLLDGFRSDEDAGIYLEKLIDEKTGNRSIRRYLSNVHICDEWE